MLPVKCVMCLLQTVANDANRNGILESTRAAESGGFWDPRSQTKIGTLEGKKYPADKKWKTSNQVKDKNMPDILIIKLHDNYDLFLINIWQLTSINRYLCHGKNKPFFNMAYIIFFYFYNIRFKSQEKTVFLRIIRIVGLVSVVVC